MTTINIYRETRCQGKGCPEDESESWTSTSKIVFVPYNEDGEYSQQCIDEYSYQDYSSTFNTKLLCTIEEEECFEIETLCKAIRERNPNLY